MFNGINDYIRHTADGLFGEGFSVRREFRRPSGCSPVVILDVEVNEPRNKMPVDRLLSSHLWRNEISLLMVDNSIGVLSKVDGKVDESSHQGRWVSQQHLRPVL